MKQAPLYTDTFMLCEWLVGRLGDDPRELARAVCRRALALHKYIVLALYDRRRDQHVDRADEELVALRAQLRLAASTGYLSNAQLAHAMQYADDIGRQLGGWLRRLGPV